MDVLSKTVAVLLSIALLFAVPLYQMLEKTDAKVQQHVYKETTLFVDNVRNKGMLTPQMYEDFMSSLAIAGYQFSVKMKHSHKVYTPVYDNSGNFKDDYEVQRDDYFNQQILPILFPDSRVSKRDPSRQYLLEIGDEFEVQVVNEGETMASVFRMWLVSLSPSSDGQVVVNYGGMVNNEDY